MFAYRKNGLLYIGKSALFDKKIGIHMKDYSIRDECSYLLDDSDKINTDFLIEIKPDIYTVDLKKLKKMLDGYALNWGFPEKENQAILNRYSSFIIFGCNEYPESYCEGAEWQH